jgi:uncharacterized protein with GYD domain
MPTYIVLASFTEQGIKNIKDSPKRAAAFKDAAKKSGATVKEIAGKQGNVRTQTLRAFSESEVKGILGKVA